MTVGNAFSEQEAYGLESLAKCVQAVLPQELPFYEVRAFGEDETSETYGMYKKDGGNYCTYVAGLLQEYLPGVASTIYRVLQMTYDKNEWIDDSGRVLPPPNSLGLRTAEHLEYHRKGRLGLHEDSGSVYSISVALSDVNDYEGGYFQLRSPNALFKVPRLSAILFESEATHGVTDILGGERNVFVVELWDNDDVPKGVARPTHEDFATHKAERREAMETAVDMDKTEANCSAN